LKEIPKEFQQVFLDVQHVPYHLNIGKSHLLGFESHATYFLFMDLLKKTRFVEKKPEFHKFTSPLDVLGSFFGLLKLKRLKNGQIMKVFGG
jgi:hypothetical protein